MISIPAERINIILHNESIDARELLGWYRDLALCFPELADEYAVNCVKKKLTPIDSRFRVDDVTAFDIQRKYGCTVLRAYQMLAREAVFAL